MSFSSSPVLQNVGNDFAASEISWMYVSASYCDTDGLILVISCLKPDPWYFGESGIVCVQATKSLEIDVAPVINNIFYFKFIEYRI